MWLVRDLYAGGLMAYTAGVAFGLAGHFFQARKSVVANVLCALALLGSLLQGAASVGALLVEQDLARCV